MLSSVFIANPVFMAQGRFADIGIKLMAGRIAVPVRFIGAHGMFVPFAGKHALAANGFKPVPDTADTGKEIDKAESIVRVGSRGRGSKFCR
jgi:hypothetical protein